MMTGFTAQELAELRAKAEAATPGPWEVCRHLEGVEEDNACSCGYRGVIWGPDHDVPMAICQPGHDREPEGQEGLGPCRYERAQEIANSQHIAALNPATALRLIQSAELVSELVEAGQRVLDGLNARIEAAPMDAVPVFDGIVELHTALAKAKAGGA